MAYFEWYRNVQQVYHHRGMSSNFNRLSKFPATSQMTERGKFEQVLDVLAQAIKFKCVHERLTVRSNENIQDLVGEP